MVDPKATVWSRSIQLRSKVHVARAYRLVLKDE